jgi:hypothetical protein
MYIAICALIGIMSIALLTDYTSKSIAAEYAWIWFWSRPRW